MKNTYITNGTVTTIKLVYKGKTLECLIDTEDLEKVLSLGVSFHARWSESAQTYYATSHRKVNGKRIGVHLHRVIMGLGDNWTSTVPDHKNRNGLDNRKENLRVISKVSNHLCSKVRADNSHGYRGITRSRGMYIAYLSGRVKGTKTTFYLGKYREPEVAQDVSVRARNLLLEIYQEKGVVDLTEDVKHRIRKSLGISKVGSRHDSHTGKFLHA